MSFKEILRGFPEDTKVDVLKETLRNVYRQSLYLTTKELLGYCDITWRTHGQIIRALEDATRRKLVIVPRGTFKSSICSVCYPIWLLLRDPNVRIFLDSELYTNSKNTLREIKQRLERQEIRALFGDFKGEPWNEGEITIRQRTIIKKEASITATGMGAEKTGQHPDVFVMDDMNSPTNSGTLEGRKKVILHYQYNQAILEPTGTLVVVGTRYAADDMAGHILATEIAEEQNALQVESPT